MRPLYASAILSLTVLTAAGFVRTGTPTPAANPCAVLTASSIGSYRTLLSKALSSATTDARTHGTNGAYAVAATNARDLLQRAYDRAGQMVNLAQRNRNTTTYAEAGTIKVHMLSILKWLPEAAHWATISAAYHRSQKAVDAFDGATAAIERGGQLMADAGQCYTAPYLSGAAKAG